MITRQSTLADPGVPWSEFSTTCCLEHTGACCKFYLSTNPLIHPHTPPFLCLSLPGLSSIITVVLPWPCHPHSSHHPLPGILRIQERLSELISMQIAIINRPTLKEFYPQMIET